MHVYDITYYDSTSIISIYPPPHQRGGQMLPVTADQLGQATRSGADLSQVWQYVHSGWTKIFSEHLKPYSHCSDDLTL